MELEYDNNSLKEQLRRKDFLDVHINSICDYFNVLIKLKIIKEPKLLDELIDKVINQLEKIVLYDSNDTELLRELGISSNNKGLSKENIIYVNKNMNQEMILITIFHELTHFLQRYNEDNKEECIGIMQDWKWRILMEAQTQNLAEIVYGFITNTKKEDVEYKSEDLRMLSSGKIVSNLRNYQMYDSILKKICVVLDLKIEDFISINFNGSESPVMWESVLENKIGKEATELLSEILDIIYSTDAIIYTGGEKILEEPYNVKSLVSGKTINVSSLNQFKNIKILDKLFFILSKDNLDKYLYLINNQFQEDNKYMEKSQWFSEVSHANQEDVETTPERFIMTECIPACRELWKKNIYTFMVSNYTDDSIIWVEIYSELSEENKKYLNSLKNKQITLNVFHEGCYQIGINHIGNYASELLELICKGFSMQEVPKNIAYIDERDFLILCGCYKEIDNPKYYEMKDFFELEFNNPKEQLEYMEKYDYWKKSIFSKKTIKTYDEKKKTKSTKEYADERNMIYEDGRIYNSKLDYQKHQKYLEHVNSIIDEQIYNSHYENGVEVVVR